MPDTNLKLKIENPIHHPNHQATKIKSKIIYLKPIQNNQETDLVSPYNVPQKLLEQGVCVVKFINNKTKKAMNFIDASFRLQLETVFHSQYRKNCVCIKKDDLEKVVDFVNRQSSGTWYVEIIK